MRPCDRTQGREVWDPPTWHSAVQGLWERRVAAAVLNISGSSLRVGSEVGSAKGNLLKEPGEGEGTRRHQFAEELGIELDDSNIKRFDD